MSSSRSHVKRIAKKLKYAATKICFVCICLRFGHISHFPIPHNGGGLLLPPRQEAGGQKLWNPLQGMERREICPKHKQTHIK